MNDPRLDAKLVAATNRRSDDTNTFVSSTMKKIRILHAADSLQQPQPTTKWRQFIRLTHAHKLAFGVIAAVMVSTIAFTSYAYAIGSDPISLIKRWIEGDTVKIEYQGRQFEHGTSRNYSDAAVTALAEANTVEGLAFRAKNAMQIPKDGVEYVGLPPSMNPATAYKYPYFATIRSVNADSVVISKQYVWGDKMNPSHEVSETITVPAATFRYFANGNPAVVSPADAGKLIMVFPETSIRHIIGTAQATPETNYFSFALTHPLEDFKQVARGGASQPGKDAILFEPNWGGLSNICGNNGADICDPNNYSRQNNQGLFLMQKGPQSGMNSYNPEAIAYGEGVPSANEQPENLISRSLSGQITAMTDTQLTLTTSSGAQWRLAYTKGQRATFAKHFSELKVGDKLVGRVLESIYNLDNRTIANSHVITLERYNK